MTGQPETVLVVDDSAFVLQTVEPLLESAGYRVEKATNGTDGLARVETCHPDLLLLDVNMPGLDGFEVYRRLKADERWEHTPVIFMTGARTEPADVARGLELGATDYVTKPFHGQVLVQRVNAAMRGYRAQREQRRLAEARAEALAALASAQMHGLEARKRSELVLLASGTSEQVRSPVAEACASLTALADDERIDMTWRAGVADAVEKLRGALRVVDRLRAIGDDLDAVACLPVEEVTRAVVAPMAAALHRQGIVVHLDLLDTTALRGATRLAPVVSELVGNAARALAGPGTIAIHTRPRRRAVELVVSDDGPGMCRTPDAQNTAGDLQLGLTMCSSIVSGLGGTLDIASGHGTGTCITIRLPTSD